MWDEYGDKGNGVMLGFESKDNILTPIQYINENAKDFIVIKDIIHTLKESNIRVHFDEIDNMRHFIKNGD